MTHSHEAAPSAVPQDGADAAAEGVDAHLAAARSAVADQFLVQDSARGRVKRLALPVSRALTSRPVAAVDALADAVEAVRAGGAAAVGRVDEDVETLRRRAGTLELRVRELEDALVRQGAAVQRLERLASSAVPGDGPVPGHGVDGAEDLLDAAGYVEFERRFRGRREEILERQRDAVRHVLELAGGEDRLLDLGCGRGEWLEVLREAGVPAFGVDSNEDMVRTGREHGLDLRHGDLLTYLEGVPEGTLGAVTGFHVAEHLPLPVLGRMLDAAARALRPGGVLLMETPNPMNIMVGASSFYLDPTHLRPLHPFFFQFLVDQRGFVGSEVHYVHPADDALVVHADPDADPGTRVVAAVSQAIFGAQDYFVVARRGPADGAGTADDAA